MELNNQIAETSRKERLLAVLKKQGAVDPDIFMSWTDRLAEQLRAAKQAKSRLLDAEENQTIAQTQKLLAGLAGGKAVYHPLCGREPRMLRHAERFPGL